MINGNMKRPFRTVDVEVDLTRYSPLWVKNDFNRNVRVLHVYEGKEMYYYATLKIDILVFEHNNWRDYVRRHLVEVCPGIVREDGTRFIITNPKPNYD